MAQYGYGISVSGSRTPLVASSGTPAPSGIPTATTNTITCQSGGTTIGVEDGAQFPKISIGYFGNYGDYKLVWSGSRWELLGDNDFLFAYNATPSQTTNYFPDQGNWFNSIDLPLSLVFVGS